MLIHECFARRWIDTYQRWHSWQQSQQQQNNAEFEPLLRAQARQYSPIDSIAAAIRDNFAPVRAA